MGLDTYAAKHEGTWTDEDKQAFLSRDIKLCGGMFSGNGQGSLRGKMYSKLVECTTGVSLYEEYIEPEIVKDMVWNIGLAIEDLTELKKFFEACAERNMGVGGWW